MKTYPHARAAYSLAEFAAMFGKERSWAYRMVKDGKVQTLDQIGNKMIPASEIDRILKTDQSPSES